MCLGDAPRAVIEEPAKTKNGAVLLPTQTGDGRPKKTVRLRCVTEPGAAEKVLVGRLGITLPRRLRRVEQSAPATPWANPMS